MKQFNQRTGAALIRLVTWIGLVVMVLLVGLGNAAWATSIPLPSNQTVPPPTPDDGDDDDDHDRNPTDASALLTECEQPVFIEDGRWLDTYPEGTWITEISVGRFAIIPDATRIVNLDDCGHVSIIIDGRTVITWPSGNTLPIGNIDELSLEQIDAMGLPPHLTEALRTLKLERSLQRIAALARLQQQQRQQQEAAANPNRQLVDMVAESVIDAIIASINESVLALTGRLLYDIPTDFPSAEVEVGPGRGETVSAGSMTVQVPPDAAADFGVLQVQPVVMSDTLVFANAASPLLLSGRQVELVWYDLAGNVRYQPVLVAPIQVCIAYTEADLAQVGGGDPTTLVVASYNPFTARWEALVTNVDVAGSQVCGVTSQMGRFGLIPLSALNTQP
ncbi:MAG: hypothetical protein HC837_19995 [Chloroflexaceae bacterium]|nr:hypothetical protein [Chloroflexaceae bacterium]